MPLDDHRHANRANWDERAPLHAASRVYDLDGFVADPARLSGVVAFDREAVGDVHGLRLAHLQCHIGTDTLSWARLGAEVTGYDFSPASLRVARDLARRAGIDATFVEGELYDAPQRLPRGAFDLVYTGTGALCWLPDIRRWAEVVADLLRPGGRLLVREGHPVLWALDHDRGDDVLAFATPYFETPTPNRWVEPHTYADDGDNELENAVLYDWNHGLGEILSAVLDAGMSIDSFTEHRAVEWQPWPLFEPDGDTGRFVLPAHLRDRLPLMYTLVATKHAGQTAGAKD